jgi:hypothetical protein
MGVLGDGAGTVVTDHGRQGGDEHQALIQQRLDAAGVGLQAFKAVQAKAVAGPGEQRDALQQIVGNQGFEDIELEIALAGGHLHGGVVAHHLQRHHRGGLALGGIHLARHDRGARFVLRQHQLTEAAAGTAAQPADVVGDLEQGARQHGE